MTRPLASVALGAVLVAAGLAAWEAFAPHTHSAEELAAAGEEHSLREFLVVLSIIAVGAFVVFGFIVRRGLRRESAAWTALALSILGLLSVAAFWSGLPPVVAAGGIVLGWSSREAPGARWAALGAVAIGAFAIAADVAVYVQGLAF